MKIESPSDAGLLSRAIAGDSEAVLELYRRRRGPVYRFALHMTGCEALAEDITQDVFLSLVRDRPSFDPSLGSASWFLCGIARNHVLRHLRRTQREDDELDDDQYAAPGDVLVEVSRTQSIEAVRAAVLSLPVDYREVVVLCDLEELDYAAAGALLRCPVGTVRSRLYRARRLLASKLKDFAPEGARRTVS